jgi:hypothetical protein
MVGYSGCRIAQQAWSIPRSLFLPSVFLVSEWLLKELRITVDPTFSDAA